MSVKREVKGQSNPLQKKTHTERIRHFNACILRLCQELNGLNGLKKKCKLCVKVSDLYEMRILEVKLEITSFYYYFQP